MARTASRPSSSRSSSARAGASASARAADLTRAARRANRRAALLAAVLGALSLALVLGVVLGVDTGPALGAGAVAGVVLGCAVWATRSRTQGRDMTREGARYRLGARSERRVGRRLDVWGRLWGWTLWHDRALPGSDANVDHLAIARGGAVVNLDSKWRDPSSRVVWDRKSGRLAVGKWSGEDLARSALSESAVLSRALGASVATVIVVDGARIPRVRLGSRAPIVLTMARGRHRGATVTVLGRRDLARWLRVHRRDAGPADAGRVGELLPAR